MVNMLTLCNSLITWVYTDEDNNSSTQKQQVTITPCPEGEPIIATNSAAEVSFFPNLAGHYLEVQDSVEMPIHVLYLSGKFLQQSITKTRVDIVALQSVMYLVQLARQAFAEGCKEAEDGWTSPSACPDKSVACLEAWTK